VCVVIKAENDRRYKWTQVAMQLQFDEIVSMEELRRDKLSVGPSGVDSRHVFP